MKKTHLLAPTLDGYAASRGPKGEAVLTRTARRLDGRVVAALFGGVSLVLPAALSVVAPIAATSVTLVFGLVALAVILGGAVASQEPPTVLAIRRRLVIGEVGPDGQLLVRVDDRAWPLREGVYVLVARRIIPRKHDGSYYVYGVILALPDAFVELAYGRKAEDAKNLRDWLWEPTGERPLERVHSQDQDEVALAFVVVGIATLMVGILLIVFPVLALSDKAGVAGHARLALVLSGPWIAAIGGGAWMAVRWAARMSRPHVLHKARKAGEEELAAR